MSSQATLKRERENVRACVRARALCVWLATSSPLAAVWRTLVKPATFTQVLYYENWKAGASEMLTPNYQISDITYMKTTPL